MRGHLRAAVLTLVAVSWVVGWPETTSAEVRVHGKVVAGDESTADVRVSLLPESTVFERGRRALIGASEVEPIAVTEAAEDGRFELEAPTSGFWRVRVEAPGWMPIEHRLHPLVSDTRLPDLELVPNIEVRVAVLDTHGGPVAGARLRAAAEQVTGRLREELASGWSVPERVGVTSWDGKAVLPAAPGERLRIEAIAQGHDTPAGASGEGAVTIRLTKGMPLTVEVLTPSGEPCGGALLRVGESGWPIGLTGADGELRLAPVAGRSLALRAVTAEGLRARALLPAAWAVAGKPVVLRLVVPVLQRGRVLPVAGSLPPDGAVVWNPEDPAGATRTGADGRFVLRVPAWRDVSLRAAARGFLAASVESTGEVATVLELRPSVALTGRVLAPSGSPVPGAVVSSPRATAAPPVAAEVGPDGRFKLTGLDPSAPCRLLATAPGWLATEAELAPGWAAGGDPVRLTLKPASVVSGRVVDAAGRPIGGAQVVLAPEVDLGSIAPPVRKVARTTSGADGGFHLKAVAGGHARLRVESEDHVAFERPGIEIRPPSPVRLGDLYLDSGVELAVWVAEPGGRPVPGAKVSARSRRRGLETSCVTGSMGSCRLALVKAGTAVTLEVRGGASEMHVDDVVPSGEPLFVTLETPRQIAGRVVDGDGRGLAGARVDGRVAATVQQGDRTLYSTATGNAFSGQEGKFALDGLPPGELEVTIKLVGYLPLRRIVAPESGDELVLRLESDAVLSGRVLGPVGEPVAGARVAVDRGADIMGLPLSAVCDEDGRYSIAGIPPGGVQVVGRHPNMVPDRRKMRLAAGGNRLDLHLGSGAQVSGRVVDGEGAPVAEARATLTPLTGTGRRQSVVTDEGGAFAIESVVPASYGLAVEADKLTPGRLAEPLDVGPEGLSGVEIVLRAGARLTGHLLGLGADDLASVRVSALGVGGVRRIGEVDDGGLYRIEGLAPGQWYVRADLDGGGGAKGLVGVAPGQSEASLDLDLSSRHRLQGLVLADGLPLAGVRVELVAAEPAFVDSVHADSQGLFTIEGVPSGDFQVRLFDGRVGLGYGEEISIEADRDWLLDLATASVSGTVFYSTGLVPAAGTVISLIPRSPLAAGLEAQTLAGADGRFRFHRVAAGAYRLRGRPPEGAPVELELVIAPGTPVSGVELLVE